MSIFEAIILGIIQGLTEFLPVSSSGHIELGKVILGVEPKDPLLFSIVVHGATALSTVVIFRKVILELIKDLFQFKLNDGTRYILMIVLSMIPVGLVGALFEKDIETFFEGKILLVGCMLIITGLLLFFTTRAKEKTGKIKPLSSIIIGISQAIAILPGISRSGATISIALLLGINKEQAARFSFLMVLPPILGALLLKTKDILEQEPVVNQASQGDVSTTALIVGFLAAFLAGLVACQWMISLVKKSKLQYFAIYCLIVGAIAIIYKTIL